MKIEKINENQIRCTLTNDDLTMRKIDLKELSYGSEKAKNLFHDMMSQASRDFGFEPNGSPIMIEAIPMADCLVLNITKVTDPEELDTRFSSFSNPASQGTSAPHFSGADGILNLIKKATEAALIKAAEKPAGSTDIQKNAPQAEPKADEKNEPSGTSPLIEAFRFSNLDDVINASKAVAPEFKAKNSLYKFDLTNYILIIHSQEEDPELFNCTCNVLSEYSFSDHVTEGSEIYLREHGYLMIDGCAIQKLSRL